MQALYQHYSRQTRLRYAFFQQLVETNTVIDQIKTFRDVNQAGLNKLLLALLRSIITYNGSITLCKQKQRQNQVIICRMSISQQELYLAVRRTDANVEHCGATVKQYIVALNCI